VEVIEFPDPAGWESWLAKQHGVRTEVWLRIAKRHSGMTSVTAEEAVETALCYGWIDGQRKAKDDVSFLQRYSRRRPRSSWSKINVVRVEALTAAGRMRPAGMAEVEAAKADGRWEVAYAGQASAVVPEDLRDALDASPAAAGFFAELDSANRYAILYRIGAVKRAETRAKKIAGFIADLERGKTPHPRKQK
jgi:uncharacterized protein YdeI (YjbR/CyaY-like superfamily)